MMRVTLQFFATKEGYEYSFIVGDRESILLGQLPHPEQLEEIVETWQGCGLAGNYSSRITISRQNVVGTKRAVQTQSLFAQLIAQCNLWLDCEPFKSHEAEIAVLGTKRLDISIDPNDSLLPHLFFEYGVLGKYQIVYCPRSYPLLAPISRAKRVLCILGKGEDLELDGDRQLLQRKFGRNLRVFNQPSIEEIRSALEQSCRMIAYCGHSEDGTIDGTALEKFDAALRQTKGLELIIFNACDGLKLIPLHRIPLPAAIVWRSEVPDVVAKYFLDKFLANLKGRDYCEAFCAARLALKKRWEAEFPGISSCIQFWERQHPVKKNRGIFIAVILAIMMSCLGLLVAKNPIAAGINKFTNARVKNDEIVGALRNYKIVEFLRRNGVGAFNQGALYEDYYQDLEKAIKLYKISADRGYLHAVADLSRLYIQNPQFDNNNEVEQLIAFCIAQSPKLIKSRDGAEGSCWILRGWKSLRNKKFGKAYEELLNGVEIIEDNLNIYPENSPPLLGYALIAKSLEGLEKYNEALLWWEKVLKNASPQNIHPTHEPYIQTAKKRLGTTSYLTD